MSSSILGLPCVCCPFSAVYILALDGQNASVCRCLCVCVCVCVCVCMRAHMCALRIVSRDKILRLKNTFIIIIIKIIIVILYFWADALSSSCVKLNEWPPLYTEHSEYAPKWCTYTATALFGCCMAGATWSCCLLSASFVYSMQPCMSLRCHFISKPHM